MSMQREEGRLAKRAVQPVQSYYSSVQSVEMVACEQSWLSANEGLNVANHNWSGIALSGGGIRSASYCLGVLQALAKLNVLKNFDYISSVSGGGYISGSLQWLWYSQPSTGTRATAFPFGTEFPNSVVESRLANQNLTFLRQHTDYLTTGNKFDFLSLIGVAFRTVYVNLLTWLIIPAILFLLMLIGSYYVSGDPAPGVFKDLPYSLLASISLDTNCKPIGANVCSVEVIPYGFLWISLMGLGVGILMLLAPLAVTLFARTRISSTVAFFVFSGAISAILIFLHLQLEFDTSTWFNWFGMPGYVLTLMVPAWLLFNILRKLYFAFAPNAQYDWNTFSDRYFPLLIIGSLFLLLLGSVPSVFLYVVGLLNQTTDKPSPSIAIVKTLAILIPATSAIGSTFYSFYTFLNRSVGSSRALLILAIVGTFVSFYAVLLLSYGIALLLFNPAATLQFLVGFSPDDANAASSLTSKIAVCFAAAVLIGAVSINTNLVGLHRFYRDRLMETFLPANMELKTQAEQQTMNSFAMTCCADLITKREPKERVPFPILNTNIVLPGRTAKQGEILNGDSFAITPLFIGSTPTGWESSESHAKRHGETTLATAIAASGAAVSSSAGYLGKGITVDRIISATMMLLNLRLGIWYASPRKLKKGILGAWDRVLQPSQLFPGLKTAIFGHNPNSRFVELSDGGHFDNTGLYELVRRKCKLIICVDAEADPTYLFSAFMAVARRTSVDFDLRMEQIIGCGVERLQPSVELAYPKDRRACTSPYFVAKLFYPADPEPGVLVYIKAALIKDSGNSVFSYAAENPSFPHETTLNQFFTSVQFDCYRDLGYRSSLEALGKQGLDLGSLFNNAISGDDREVTESQLQRIVKTFEKKMRDGTQASGDRQGTVKLTWT